MGNRQTAAAEAPPEEFVRLVKDALEHLYDFPYLQKHRLAQFYQGATHSGEMSGHRLRVEILAAIQSLNPGPSIAFRDPKARLFNLLQLHYVEGMTIQETAHELGLSERQAYRDLRQANEGIATLLWSRQIFRSPEQVSAASNENAISSVEAEMDRLTPVPQPVELGQLLARAQRAVERLAVQRGVNFLLTAPDGPTYSLGDPVLAQQVFTHLLSHTVQQAEPGELTISVVVQAEGIMAVLRYRPAVGQSKTPILTPMVAELIERLGWQITQQDQPSGHRVVTINTSACGPSVLIIDDNQGLLELLQRYLSGLACQVWTATSGDAGLRLAVQLIPDAIILDVMMPEMDGWELLQRLRANPSTSTIPVIICSVFNDAELAYSLGATVILTKPVKQADILNALRQLRVL